MSLGTKFKEECLRLDAEGPTCVFSLRTRKPHVMQMTRSAHYRIRSNFCCLNSFLRKARPCVTLRPDSRKPIAGLNVNVNVNVNVN
jgi:hypothetical protein